MISKMVKAVFEARQSCSLQSLEHIKCPEDRKGISRILSQCAFCGSNKDNDAKSGLRQPFTSMLRHIVHCWLVT